MKKILVVDDEPLLLDLLNHLLSHIGYQVNRALDGREAAGNLKNNAYDLILLDIKMPSMSGKDFYFNIKEQLPEMTNRIVFLTGDLLNQETMNFIKKTGNLHLQKPFTIKEVKTLLENFFKAA